MKRHQAVIIGLPIALAVVVAVNYDKVDEPTRQVRADSTIAKLAERRPESVDMTEFARLSGTIGPALKRGAQCKTLDCSKRALTPACESLAKMDDMAYDIEERIGQAASFAIADASSSCKMALHYMGKGDADLATAMVREIDDSLARATRALSRS